jgi:hypothetical protein
MYTKYNDPAANAYAKMCGVKNVNESDEDLQELELDTGTEEAPEGDEGTEEEQDPLDVAIAEYEAAAEAALEQEDEEGAAKNTQLADWLKELKEFKAAAEGDEGEVEGEEGIDEDRENLQPGEKPRSDEYKPFVESKKVTESAPCCKKAKITTVEPVGKKIK